MMDAQVTRYSFWCFIFVLGAIVILYALAAVLAWSGKPVESLGIGGAGTGLIGVLGTFKPRSGMPTQNINQADSVNQGAST